MTKGKIILFFIVLLILFRIFFGEISIHLKIPLNIERFEINVSEKIIGSETEFRKNQTIIPFILKVVSHDYFISDDEKRIKINYGETIILNIKSYDCFSSITGKEKKTRCNSNTNNIKFKENLDYIYDKMTILGNNSNKKGSNIIYEGIFKENITSILKNKGIYNIIIFTKNKYHNADIYLTINII